MSILVGIPCYNGWISDITNTGLFELGKLLLRHKIDHGLLTLSNQSLISFGRSKIANFFLNNTQFEYLLFLDSDIGFRAEDVIQLLSYKKQLISGAYPLKTLPLQWNYTLTEPAVLENPLIGIDSIGIGFSLIHRTVFQAIADKYGSEIKYIPQNDTENQQISPAEIANSYHFFREMHNGFTWLSEDISFFLRAKSCGFQAWLDTSIKLRHLGSHIYSSN